MTSALTEARPAEPAIVRPALGPYLTALVTGWIALGALAWVFAGVRRVPFAIALPIALAFLTEYSFYLLLGFSELRTYLAVRFTRLQLSGAIALSAVLPYFLYALTLSPTLGKPQPGPAILYAALMAAVAFWYVPRVTSPVLSGIRDLAFLTLLAVIIVSGLLARIMPEPVHHVPMEVLGHISLVRSAVLAVILIRGVEETGIGFIPRVRDLGIGFTWFLAAAVIALPLAWRLGQLRIAARMPGLWQSIGLLLGVFWVLALSEEFFFRALLLKWVSRWMRSTTAGLVIASLLFGACHLGWSRNVFPNWRYALLATILGLACGAAFLQARSIRASMVTHALLVGVWRLFLS